MRNLTLFGFVLLIPFANGLPHKNVAVHLPSCSRRIVRTVFSVELPPDKHRTNSDSSHEGPLDLLRQAFGNHLNRAHELFDRDGNLDLALFRELNSNVLNLGRQILEMLGEKFEVRTLSGPGGGTFGGFGITPQPGKPLGEFALEQDCPTAYIPGYLLYQQMAPAFYIKSLPLLALSHDAIFVGRPTHSERHEAGHRMLHRKELAGELGPLLAWLETVDGKPMQLSAVTNTIKRRREQAPSLNPLVVPIFYQFPTEEFLAYAEGFVGYHDELAIAAAYQQRHSNELPLASAGQLWEELPPTVEPAVFVAEATLEAAKEIEAAIRLDSWQGEGFDIFFEPLTAEGPEYKVWLSMQLRNYRLRMQFTGASVQQAYRILSTETDLTSPQYERETNALIGLYQDELLKIKEMSSGYLSTVQTILHAIPGERTGKTLQRLMNTLKGPRDLVQRWLH